MVVWKEELFCAGISEKKQKRIVRAIGKKRPVGKVYLITAPSNPENKLDLLQANQLLQSYYKNREVCVYGLAGSEEDAMELAAAMVCGTYAATGSFDVIGYLEILQGKAGDSA